MRQSCDAWMHSSISKGDEKNRFLAKPFKYVEAWFYIFFICRLDLSSLAQHRNVFTFGGAKRNRSDKECTKFPIGMNAREQLWR